MNLEEEGKRIVTKKARKFKVEFASKTNNEETLMTITKDNHLLKMNFLGKKNKMRKLVNSKGKINKNIISYSDIEEGIDLEYLCEETKIKENVIIKSKQDNYDYDFNIDIGDLEPVFNEKENTLELKKEGKSIYRVLSPYMEDSNGNRNDECSYDIEQEGKILTLHLHCDNKWINENSRAFPITVDPTIEIIDNDEIEYISIVNGLATTNGSNITIGSILTEIANYYALKIHINLDKFLKGITNIQSVSSIKIKFNVVSTFLHSNTDFYVINENEIIDQFTFDKTNPENALTIDISKIISRKKIIN